MSARSIEVDNINILEGFAAFLISNGECNKELPMIDFKMILKALIS